MEMGAIPDLTGIDLVNRSSPQVILGLGPIARLRHKGLVQDMRSQGTEAMIARGGLAAVEIANAMLGLNEELSEQKRLMGIKSKEASAHEARAAKLDAELEIARKQFKDLTVIHGSCSDRYAAKEREMVADFERQRASFEGSKQMEIEAARREAIAAYKGSVEFRNEVAPQVMQYFDRGVDHILRVAASSQRVDINHLTSWKREDPYGPAARLGHPWVPYTPQDLEMIKARDIRKNMPVWDPPPLNEAGTTASSSSMMKE